MAKRFEPAPSELRSGTGLHRDDTSRRRGCELVQLRTVEFLANHRSADPVDADDVKPILSEIDAKNGNC